MNDLLKRAIVGACLIAAPMTAQAVTLQFDDTTSVSSNTPHTGASAAIDMTMTDFAANEIRIDLAVTNTTGVVPSFGAGATASSLTGFGFDLLAGLSFGQTLVVGSNLDTTLMPAVLNPFDDMDLGFADNSNFVGGNAQGALLAGQTDNLSFTLAIGTSGFTAASLDAAMQAAFDAGTLQGTLRFQVVNAGAGSDKLNYTGTPTTPPSTVPLPAAGLLLMAGLGGVGALRRRKKTS